MSASSDGSTAIHPPALQEGRVRFPAPFRLDSGDVLECPRVDYSLFGPTDGPLVVALGGISAGRAVTGIAGTGPAGWWSDMVGPGNAVDTDRFRVLGIDWLGKSPTPFRSVTQGPGGTNGGPRSKRSFPVISTRDQARILHHVLTALGIGSVHTLVGASYGGMVGLAFAARYRDLLERLVVISAAHRTHPMATAHRIVQRRIVELGRAGGCADEGLALSRALAMTTYRSIEEFELRFDATPGTSGGECHFEVEEYLLAQGAKFCRRFTPDAFLSLSLSIDIHDVPPSSVGVPTELVSVDSDTLVPRWLMRELERGLAGPCRHHQVDSIFGHDAFLKEVEVVGGILSQILDREAVSS